MLDFKNAAFTKNGDINCEFNHPELGWIPYTASANDVVGVSRDLFEQAKTVAAPYVAPVVDPQEALAKAEKEIRQKRNGLLAQSDWIVARAYEAGEPVPVEWVDYRQALRDITMQPGFPHEVVWPTKPE